MTGDLPALNRSQRVLVTGATGLVGNNVTRLLRAQGVPVRVLMREPARGPSGRGVGSGSRDR